MNSREKEVQLYNLSSEKKILQELQRIYERASNDCKKKIEQLNARTDMQNLQSIIYQAQYQQALSDQIDGILDTLQGNEFESIADYLGKSYEDGYLGAKYDLQGQGIPVIDPIDQSKAVKALQTDSKISGPLYNRLGEDVDQLKASIRSELSRGIANGSSWLDIANRIASGMNSPFNAALNRAKLIARTEGHRVQQESQLDALEEAKDAGADIVKQWDATLDSRTRPDHRKADGQIRELDDYFDVGGEKMEAPGVGGSAKQVCNCRCCLLQRAKWALDEDELKELQKRAEYYGLDKTDDFEDFKDKYLKATEGNADNSSDLMKSLKNSGIEYNGVKMLDHELTEDEIIARLGGGDQTIGSCASLAYAYMGNKCGYDVLDYRGGDSRATFSNAMIDKEVLKLNGVQGMTRQVRNEISETSDMLKETKSGKEYLLSVGKHAAIVRRGGEAGFQYLELQTVNDNGWHDLTKSTLRSRFGATKSRSIYGMPLESPVTMIDVDSVKGNEQFREMLGYINTNAESQFKGANGYAK